MPNWCNNNLTLTHEDPAMILRAKEALDRGEFLNEFIPVPEDLKITSGFLGDGDAQKELERQTKANVEKYGYGNWYDYCVGEWAPSGMWVVMVRQISIQMARCYTHRSIQRGRHQSTPMTSW
jgi:hypothetical protein